MELSSAVLDAIPDLTSCWGCPLSTDKIVDARLKLGERVLNMCALGEAGPEESGVDSQQDPGTALEEDGAKE